MTGAHDALTGGTVRLTVDLDPATFAQATDGGWFHLAGGGSDAAAPTDALSYRLVLRLGDAAAADLPESWRDADAWYAEDVERERSVPPELDGPDVRLAVEHPGARMVETARSWLVDRGFEPRLVEDSTILRLEDEGDNGSWVLWVETIEDEGVVRVFSSWPHEVPPERRPEVMELITRANLGLSVGAFQLDLDRGQVSLATAIDLGGEPLTPGLLEGLVRPNVTAFDEFLPRLQAAVDGADAWLSRSASDA